jgi:hypothetical protein
MLRVTTPYSGETLKGLRNVSGLNGGRDLKEAGEKMELQTVRAWSTLVSSGPLIEVYVEVLGTVCVRASGRSYAR